MKKVSIVMLLLVVLTGVFCLAACTEKSEIITVDKYEITESKYTVGDTFDKSKVVVTAYKSDETTATISKNLVLSKDGLASLALDADNKLTKAGTFTIKVYILEENENYPEFFIGDWTIVVKAKK